MKRTKINLLVNKRDYGKIDHYFRLLRRGVLVYTILTFVFVVTFMFLHFRQSLRLQGLIREQEAALVQLQGQKDSEVKLIYAANKLQSVERFLLEDAKFHPYYNLLLTNIGQSSESGQLSTLSIDKDRAFEFTLTYGTFEQLLSSFRLVESQEFLKNFETLSLVNFTTGKENQTYQLTFKGKFKKI